MKWTTILRDLIHGCTWVDLRSGQPLETGVWCFTQRGASRDALKTQERQNRDMESRGLPGRGVAYVALSNADLQAFLDGWGKPTGSRLTPEQIQAVADLEPGESITFPSGLTMRRTAKP